MDGSASLAAIFGYLVDKGGLVFQHDWLLRGLAVSATGLIAFSLVLVQPPLWVDGLVKLGFCTEMWCTYLCSLFDSSFQAPGDQRVYQQAHRNCLRLDGANRGHA